MKEINLGRILVDNRRKMGITQEALANYLGISTAAVSKWETEATYPDIQMLPRLAAYFDISIDELIGYEPQLDKAEIQNWYRRLSEEFASVSFDEAAAHCRELTKKYYSCYPFLFQIASLLVNYSPLSGSAEKSEQIIEEALELFRRVKKNIEDAEFAKAALQMEAYCLLALRRPAEVLRLLELKPPAAFPAEPLLASACQMTGNIREAKKVLQAGIYQQLLSLIGLLSSYMGVCADDPDIFAESCRRLETVADAFHLDELHPGILLSCYFAMAQGWAVLGETENALDALEKYTSLASDDIYPLKLHGDSFFNLLDDWISDTLELGSYPPRKESVIRRSITQALTDHPAFADFSDHPRFQEMVRRLNYNEEET